MKPYRDALRVREGYWFAPKLYGFGATPVTWQGWAMTGALLVAVLAMVRFAPDDLTRLAVLAVVLAGFLAAAWTKTDGGWSWHWGPRDRVDK
ncbi:hypothetical protein [Sphingomonas japonica]|uniref:Uncharacterized protein n=1 Tax=Sphingomonas japonica TaxID=511662 RepID=A0ABX0U1D8_9SPHN|nr:hypothetical protein [Sphingomonas japonica]NIJ22607.1 hypothetical protein [Sphingomonas japonica]